MNHPVSRGSRDNVDVSCIVRLLRRTFIYVKISQIQSMEHPVIMTTGEINLSNKRVPLVSLLFVRNPFMEGDET